MPTKPVLHVDARNRAAFLRAAAERLRRGESIVRAIDTYRASGTVTVQVPFDPAAEVVAREPPRLQPGGITEIVTYLRVKDTTFREVTLQGATAGRDVVLLLRPLCEAGRVLAPPSRSGVLRES